MLENNTVPVFWTANDISEIDRAFLRRMTYAIEFEKLVELNNAYNIPPALIINAINTAQLMSNNSKNITADFEKSIKNISTLINYGRDIKTHSCECKNYNLGLVRANLDIENLTEKITEKGKLNFSLCLYGQSGTGKSEYARYLAKRLNIKAVLKKASDLMSPYIGQTEINIARAFEEAKREKAMLIIDEADSFLHSRQNAQRSWEISQVNEMLTCMENHPFPFVCTTNLVDILDEASLRRFTFKIKFDFLSREQIGLSFRHFFKVSAPEEILSCYGLTSGDFALVSKKADYMDCKNKPLELAKLLLEEVEMKSISGKKLGFN
jgi:SpoVK/Ycf46/Vps4 family AAA+-type ATPase